MATRKELDDYIRRGLRLIRLANGFTSITRNELSRLGVLVRTMLVDQSPTTRVSERNQVVRELRTAVLSRYAQIASRVEDAVTPLTTAEATFATRASALSRFPSRERLARAAASALFAGNSPLGHWRRQGENLAFELQAGVNQYRTDTGVARAAIRATLDRAQVNAAKLVHAQTQAAAHAGRVAAWEANGVKAVRWFAILDPKVCINCGMRAGKLYNLQNEPIGHDVPMVSPPPFHYWCRCMLVPERGDVTPSLALNDRFETWLRRQPVATQEDVLGVGRTELWRKGSITLSDLINQRGLAMTLQELENDT